ncbi:O-methyltransferase [Rickettsiales bacterium]|nr:O-methyltransferase [Rickettsiales bacterium]
MSRDKHNSKELEYIRELFALQCDALSEVGQELPTEERIMQIGPEEGKLIHFLAKLCGAKKIVEVGVLAGYSAICMAKALPDDGHLYAIERNYKRIEPSLQNFEKCAVADKITLLEGDAVELLEEISEAGPFDMIFIDADKGGYCSYLDWAEKNIRKGGLIIGDNTLFFGHIYKSEKELPEGTSLKSYNAIRQFNQRLSDSSKYTSIIIPSIEGLTVAIKNF